MKDKIKLATYKNIDIYYLTRNAKINFVFEGVDRTVSYVFEAEEIIDEPCWEKCDLKGYFAGGVFRDYMGMAIATQRDVKSGMPRWKVKGEYDSKFKYPDSWKEIKVYPENKKNNETYSLWKKQHLIVEENKAKEINIIARLKL